MASNKNLSFEFFPPRNDEALDELARTAKDLGQLNPEFFSVTYGAGGSSQNKTLETVLKTKAATNLKVAPHLTCVGSNKENIKALLDEYQSHNIDHLVCLRGDIPSGLMHPGEFLHASDLVSFIREYSGDHFTIDVASYPEPHPESNSPDEDVKHFINKAKAGANSSITQYFYNVDAYLYFVDKVRSEGMDIPIVPGIMPITNYKGLIRFSAACGAEIPRWIQLRLEAYQHDKESLKTFGEDVVSSLCQQLIDNDVPGLHFYTMNKSGPTLNICNNLDLG